MWSNTPFYIVFLSSILPWILLVFINDKVASYIPEGMSMFAFIIFVVNHKFKIFLPNKALLLFSLLLLYAMVALLTGRGIGSGGVVIVIVTTFIFWVLLEKRTDSAFSIVISRQIGIIYLFHVLFIMFEMVVQISGNVDLFLSVSDANDIKIYKSYNSAAFLRFIGFNNVSGMNSLLLGSQSASILTLLSAMYFYLISKNSVLTLSSFNYMLYFVLALFIFPSVASMTSTLTLLLLIFVSVYWVPVKGLYNKLYKIVLPVFLVLFNSVLVPIIFFRIRNNADYEEYMLAFMAPVYAFFNLPLSSKIFGYGRDTLFRKELVPAADFGIGMIIFQGGLFLFIIAVVGLIWIVLSGINHIRVEKNISSYYNPWVTVLGVNVVCVIGWFFSLIHYTTAIELGGRQIFSLHLAVCLLSINRLKEHHECNMRKLIS